MNAQLTPDGKFIHLTELTDIEIRQLHSSFTKKIPNWFLIKQKNSAANIETTFINTYNYIPAGLWVELLKVCKRNNFSINFLDDFNCKIKSCDFDISYLQEYIDELFKNNIKNIYPYQHQIEGVYNIFLYKNCNLAISTSGGKTLLAYLMFKFFLERFNIKKILYVVPNMDLATQSLKKFLIYDEDNGVETTWTHAEIHSAAKKLKEYNHNIIFGTYQSLCKKPASFFEDIDVLFVDEAAHAKANSIKNIISKCGNAKYKIGVTGTFPKSDTYESFVIQSYIGPLVYEYKSSEMIYNDKLATPVHCYGMLLDYLSFDEKRALYNIRRNINSDTFDLASKTLNNEKVLARKSKARFKYICDLAMGTKKNTLILFGDVQTGYGKKIYHHIKENSGKNIFYIDGGIDNTYREYAKEQIEEDTTGNTIIVASIGTFAEGIDIGNLWNIILVETTKSDDILGQILGRGMRNYPGKDKVILVDIGDDFRFGQHDNDEKLNNYLYKHFIEREKIYKERGFPYHAQYINLNENKLF